MAVIVPVMRAADLELAAATPQLVPGDLHQADRTWYTWRHTAAAQSARDAALPRAPVMHFDWELLQAAPDLSAYEEALCAKYGRAWH